MDETKEYVFLKGRFGFRSPALLLPKARLYADRLELSGWQFGGRFHRDIPLRRVLQVDVPSDAELLIWLSAGVTLHLCVAQASRWKKHIEAQQARLKNLSSTSEQTAS